MTLPTPTDTRIDAEVLRVVEDGILDAISISGPMGAPGGVMYAALSASGFSLNTFNSIMHGMIAAGLIRRNGDLYHLLPKGEERRKAATVA